MYSNRRRSHVHFIHQYKMDTDEYTGTRVVIFRKASGKKEIKDIGDFKIHKYKNPKTKKNKVSGWSIKTCELEGIVKKEMTNTSIDEKYKMCHVLYESAEMELDDYLEEVMELELLNTDIVGK
ncbi:hypothetical protein [Anaeromicrobium sediminis]|uniref:Uncharacterized protein n=1 Tax=Anaeromicrobium sediminis TaxID=1478221 RepID=A0A267MN15_9FIRM|nr:hypothetical protein [Anaeromicrobium sediminis]PAB60827.1 hypothetical protein CCE28_04645 [Anaeromicrobium sediminis]